MRLLCIIFIALLVSSCGPQIKLNRAGHQKGPNYPKIDKDGWVVFSISAPYAESVFLEGDFTDWCGRDMVYLGDGLWSATLKLRPGRIYYYRFSVDGYNIADPDNPDFYLSGDNTANSIFVLF